MSADEADVGVTVTSAEAIARLREAWINERISKILLPHQLEVVDALVCEIRTFSKSLEPAEGEELERTDLTQGAHRAEMDRIEYMINSYLRSRLLKIEANAAGILMDHAERQELGKPDLMDDREVHFAEKLHSQRLGIFNTLFLSKLPDVQKNLPIPRTTRNTRALIRVNESTDIRSVSVFDTNDPNNELLVDFERGSIHHVPLQCVQDKLENGEISLL